MRSRVRILLSKRKALHSSLNDVRTRVRLLTRRKLASNRSPLLSALDDVRSRMRILLSKRKSLHSSLNDVRTRVRLLAQRKIASDPTSLLSALDDVRSRARVLAKSDNARAGLLAVGIAALFAVALQYGEYQRAPQTSPQASIQPSIPACDTDLCGNPVANLTPETVSPQETPVVEAPIVEAPVVEAPVVEAPVVGHVQNDDADRQPPPAADQNRPPAPAIETQRQPLPALKANLMGIVISRKTGARARVGTPYAPRFQAYIDDLESNHGARVLFMGGIRPGHCRSSSLHPCGKALDVCQLSRGVVDARCHLPARRALGQIAARHGLFEGGRWCNSDYGHAQAMMTARDCGDRRTRIARRHMAPHGGRQASATSFD